jgi:hypothetical protein
MELRNSRLTRNQGSSIAKLRNRLAGLTTLVMLATAIAAMLLPAASASSPRQFLRGGQSLKAQVAGKALSQTSGSSIGSALAIKSLLMAPAAFTETVDTFAANCTTPQTSFNLGDTVCAKVTGAPVGASFVQRRFQWANTEPLVTRQDDISTDPQTSQFTLPTTDTSVLADHTIDNRGTWRVNVLDTTDGSARATTFFTVHDPATPTADVEVSAATRLDSVSPAAGSDLSFIVLVKNNGPDSATLTLTNAVPASTSFVGVTQVSGPSASCSNPAVGDLGTSTCTITGFSGEGVASLQFTYHVDLGATDGTVITDTANVSTTITETDSTNNSSSASATVTTPTCTITPPADITQQNDLDAQGHALGGAFVTYSDPTTSSSVSPSSCGVVECSPASGSFFPVGVNVVTCTDSVNPAAHFRVTIQDTEAPTITCPANVTAPENPHGSGHGVVNYPAPTATDNSGHVTVTTDHDSGSTFPLGSTTVTATATDDAGHTATCTFTVTVVVSDCTITCPANISQAPDPGQNGAIVNYPPVTATGTTCGTITYSKESGTFFPLGTTTVTVTASAGETCSFTVNVSTDTTAPVITCPAAIVQPATGGTCQATVNPGTATATDDSGSVSVSGTRSDGFALNDQYPVGETIITWTATDGAGNSADCTQSVKVTENVPPTVTAPAPVTVNVNSSCDDVMVPNFLNGLVASDNCTPTANLESSQSPAAETTVGVGSHTVTITVTDVSGNVATVTTTFNVVDNTPPTITLNGASSVTVECHTSFSDPGATASDNCGTATITTSGSPNINAPGTYTVTYTATDGSGNHASVQRTVTVVDTTPPTINCAANITVNTEPGSCSAHASPGASASDSCDTSVTVTGVRSDGQALNASYPKGTTSVTWTATDDSGNHSSCVQTVTVVDNEPPVISCAADIVADFDPAVNGAVVTYTAPVGTDNCAGATTAQTAGLASGATFPLGTTTNTFTVTDAAGHTASCSFKVTVALTSIVGLDSASISGASSIDSYSSALGYPASKSSLANLLSNGTITMGNSGKVWGNVRSTRVGVNMTGASQVTGNATAGTTVSRSGSATVGGVITNNALAPVMTLPSIGACSPFSSNAGISGTYSYNASTGDLTLSGVNIATLANGNYCFHNVTLGNSGQLKVNGPVVIKLTGTLNTSGATNLNNTTQIPSNLRILSSLSGGNGIVLGNSTSVYALIYAPNTGVNISGSAPMFGTVVGKSITSGNSGMIHYDTQLKSIWPELWALIVGP